MSLHVLLCPLNIFWYNVEPNLWCILLFVFLLNRDNLNNILDINLCQIYIFWKCFLSLHYLYILYYPFLFSVCLGYESGMNTDQSQAGINKEFLCSWLLWAQHQQTRRNLTQLGDMYILNSAFQRAHTLNFDEVQLIIIFFLSGFVLFMSYRIFV